MKFEADAHDTGKKVLDASYNAYEANAMKLTQKRRENDAGEVTRRAVPDVFICCSLCHECVKHAHSTYEECKEDVELPGCKSLGWQGER